MTGGLFINGSFASNLSSFKAKARSIPDPTATPAKTAIVNCELY